MAAVYGLCVSVYTVMCKQLRKGILKMQNKVMQTKYYAIICTHWH